MFSKVASTVLLGAGILSLTNAECPNACSSHGVCSNYDMCMCYRNWMANDCSERVCQFGLAHVDTPKGDMDASSGALSGPSSTVIVNSEVYPYGTTEQFPNMVDSAGNQLSNTAHYYMECSNKGLCDRETGTCECFEGYEGSACQRASCPGDCSGHGVCNSIKEIAKHDNGNIYELWDEDITLGCECDAGYYGADCSLRKCKYGADPLYLDDGINSGRVANWTLGFTSDGSSDAQLANLHGSFSIVFYDVFGEDWRTEAIAKDADCDAITLALESLPNDVIAHNSVHCFDQLLTKHGGSAVLPDHYQTLSQSSPHSAHLLRAVTLVFSKNVGVLKQPEIDMYLDGDRASLYTEESDSSLKSFVFADGFHGEFDDYVPDHCEDVLVTLTHVNNQGWVLDGLDAAETKLLKACLGDSNGNTGLGSTGVFYADGTTSIPSQSDETYDWDQGSIKHPHLIKLVQQRDRDVYTRICNATNTYNAAFNSVDWCDNYSPAGFYLPLIYDANLGFRLFGLTGATTTELSPTTQYHVFTTTGMLLQIGMDSGFTTDNLFSRNVYYEKINNAGQTSKDCETMAAADKTDAISGREQCLDKGDRVMFFYMGGHPSVLDLDLGAKVDQTQNTKHHNIYTIDKISVGRTSNFAPRTEIVVDMGINFAHLTNASAYKFYPPTGASWAKECSDRGNCNTDTGLCECYTGYTHDDCSVQNTLAQ